MRPEKIVVQAFGPYMERCEVDFEPLRQAQIFLLSGPTGSGKTTILDAMSFALYGEPTGELREWKQMRNTACSGELPTIAEVQFSLGDDHFRFRRTLTERIRKKRSGGQETVYDQESECFCLEGDEWKLLASGGQVSAKAKELLGFSREQFAQVIVLPQGEFQKLLVASSTEKESILQMLFSTGRWLRFTRVAEEWYQQLQTVQKEQMSQKTQLLAREEVENAAQLQEKLDTVQKACGQARELSHRLAVESEQASKKLTEAQALAGQFAQMEKLKQTMQSLAGKKEEMERQALLLKADERARRILPFYEALETAQKEYPVKKQQQEEAQKSLLEAEKEFGEAGKQAEQIPGMEARQNQLQRQEDEVRQAYEDLQRWQEADKSLETCRKEQAGWEQKLAESRRQEQELKARIAKGKKLIDSQIEPLAQKLPDLKAQLQLLQTAEEDLFRLTRCRKEQEEAQAAWESAQKKRDSEQSRLQALRESAGLLEAAVRADSAFHLSLSLQDGDPCPVCGSKSHPMPAQAALETPSLEKVEQMRGMVREAELSLESAQREADRRETMRKAAGQAAQEAQKRFERHDIPSDQLADRLSEKRGAVAEAQKASDQRPRYQEGIRKLEAQWEQSCKAITQQTEQLSACQSRTAAAQARAEELAKRLGDKVPQKQGLEKRLQSILLELQQVRKSMERLRLNQQQASARLAGAQKAVALSGQGLLEAEQRMESARNRWTDICLKEQIAPDQQVKDMLMEERVRIEGRQAVTQYEQDCRTVQAQLEQLGEELSGKTLPELSGLQQKKEDLRVQKTEADEKVGVLQEQLRRMDQESAELGQLEKKLGELDEQYIRVSRLAELLRGKNDYNTPIHQFVLGLMLDDIVATANEYLNHLSRGQYSLVRMDAKGGRGYRGLELYVMDAHRGGIRTVRTLSGGELFLASLSLAFGLSDVVQGYAGGVRLDSIFIDEGFGTLDEETLDAAMMALSRIQSSGRMVGIISHVQELKDRISARIEIVPDQNGGSRAMVCR